MNRLSLVVLAVLLFFSSCVSDSENANVIFQRNLEDIEKYVSQNNIPSVKEFIDPDSGIRIYWQETSESGILPNVGDSLFVDYVGKLLDNYVFDTSVDSVARANNMFNPNRDYEPLEMVFGIGQMIFGFEFAMSKMEKGDIATVLMPSTYAYGPSGRGSIPPNAPLLFELNLVELKPKE